VHPAKVEVRFRSSERIFSGVQRAARRALLAYSPVPPVAPGTWQSPYTGRAPDPAWEMPRDVEGGAFSSQRTLAWEAYSASPVDGDTPAEEVVEARPDGEGAAAPTPSEESQPRLLTGMLPLLRLVGQVGLAYLIAEGPDGLYLIDQHAAHERVLFERFMKQRSAQIASQALLEPATVHLSASSAQLLQSQLGVLGGIGFEVEAFGPNTFRVRAIPALLGSADPHAALRVIVEDFEEDETPLQAEVEARLIARVCKRAAVKAGQALSTEEQRALLNELEACRSPRTCPHGRPTMIHLSVDLLERQFGRRGGR
jgi:DNA mismatch repair protein MutL